MGSSKRVRRSCSSATKLSVLAGLLQTAACSFAQVPIELIRPDTVTWLDSARQRAVPVALYGSSSVIVEHSRPVLLSHGYNEERPGTYLQYSYLAEKLAMNGCLVVSIQHELPGDPPLAMKGDLPTLRRPNWERGAQNILFVLAELKRRFLGLDYSHTTLIGHSNGGDMSALFTEQHPELVESLITLDNRRNPLPRDGRVRMLTLRSNDAPADKGVLPSAEERAAHGIRIVTLHDVKHNEMSDRANAVQRARITGLILDFL